MYGETSWTAAVAYENVEDRDHAAAAVLDSRIELMGEELHVKEALAHPLPVVHSPPFVSAAEAPFGQALGHQ